MLFGLGWNVWAAIALFVVAGIGFLWSNRGALASIKLPSVGGSPVVDDDAADFQALTRLQKRYARLNCPEGKAAVQTCLAHFYHEA